VNELPALPNTFAEMVTQLEELGESTVRELQSSGHWGADHMHHHKWAAAWLSSKDRARSEAFSNKRDAREEETLEIAREANSIARSASLAATAAAAAASEANVIARHNRLVAIAAAIVAGIAPIIAMLKT
jgi:hypothetical protein